MSTDIRKSSWSSIFVVRGSVLEHVWEAVVFFSLYGAAIGLIAFYFKLPKLPLGCFSVGGIAIGLMLTFKTNASYDRFWEGRKAWGSIVNRSRNLVRQLKLIEDEKMRSQAIDHLLQFVHALKRQLWGDLRIEGGSNMALQALTHLGEVLDDAKKAKLISDLVQMRLDENITILLEQLGVCERIRSTPLPPVIVIYIKRFILGYCFLIPFAMHSDLGLYTFFGSGLVAYIFFGVERVGSEIENPFKKTVNDLDLAGITDRLERELLRLAQTA